MPTGNPALVAPWSVPELITVWAPVLMVSVDAALPTMLPWLISVKLALPIVPAPEMVLPELVSVAALPSVAMALWTLFDGMILPPPDRVREVSSSSRVGSVEPLSVMEPALRKVPPRTSVELSATTMAPELMPVPVPSVAVKLPAVISSVAPREVTIDPMTGLSATVLLTAPPVAVLAWVLEPGMPLVQLLVVDQSPVPPAFQPSELRLMRFCTIAEFVPSTAAGRGTDFDRETLDGRLRGIRLDGDADGLRPGAAEVEGTGRRTYEVCETWSARPGHHLPTNRAAGGRPVHIDLV